MRIHDDNIISHKTLEVVSQLLTVGMIYFDYLRKHAQYSMFTR